MHIPPITLSFVQDITSVAQLTYMYMTCIYAKCSLLKKHIGDDSIWSWLMEQGMKSHPLLWVVLTTQTVHPSHDHDDGQV